MKRFIVMVSLFCIVMSAYADMGMRRQVWLLPESVANVDNDDFSPLFDVINGPIAPDLDETIAISEYGSWGAENYVSKVYGWIIPPVSGNYTFWVASDDEFGFWLGQDASLADANSLICSVQRYPAGSGEYWTGWDQWDKQPMQMSAPVYLEAGEMYAFMGAHREGCCGDHARIAWGGPAEIGAGPVPIDSQYLLDTDPYLASRPNIWPGTAEVKDGQLSWIPPSVAVAESYNVYLGTTDPNEGTNPLLDNVTDSSVYAGAVDGTALQYDTVYYWRVDVVEETTGTVHEGTYWSFKTLHDGPVITSQPAERVDALVGQEVIISVEAETLGDQDLKYQWFVLDGEAEVAVTDNSTENADYIIPAISLDDEGQYFCRVSNTSSILSSVDSSLVAVNAQIGLVHRYAFDDPNDYIGGADSVLVNNTGNASFVDGQLVLGNTGGQYSNDNNGDYVDLPNGIISALGAQATFEAWVTWNKPTTGGDTWQRIFDFGTSNGGENQSPGGDQTSYIFLTPRSGPGIIRYAFRNQWTGAETVYDADAEMASGVETHVAVTFDAYGNSALYLNGQLARSRSTNGNTLTSLTDNNNWLGRAQWNDPTFTGSFNEFRIYDISLSAGWIKAHYEAGPDVYDVADACDVEPEADLTGDCIVDMQDFAKLAIEWMECGLISCQ